MSPRSRNSIHQNNDITGLQQNAVNHQHLIKERVQDDSSLVKSAFMKGLNMAKPCFYEHTKNDASGLFSLHFNLFRVI